jgi:DNA-binding response OmpR family regulator
LKILGIDDNTDLLDLCKVVLTSDGHEYTGVTKGREGLEEIRNGNYDLVLLDLSMPEFSGIDVIDALDKDGLMNKQKIVIFTASSATEKEYGPLLEKGAHSVIKKPLDVDLLVEHIKKIESEG